MNDQTPDPIDNDILDVTLSESLQTRWPARAIPERQVQTILTNIETQNRKFTMQTRISNLLRPVAFVGGLALLVLALSWILGSMRPNPAVETPVTSTPLPFNTPSETTLPAENPDPNATATPTAAVEPTANPTQQYVENCEKTTVVVVEGDTLSTISANYQVPMETLRQWNNLSGDTVFAGLSLVIPLCERDANLSEHSSTSVFGFSSMPNVTFSFANALPTSLAQVTLYQQHPEGALSEDSVRQMAQQMGVNGEITSYIGEGGDTVYNVTNGDVQMIFYGYPDQFSYFTTSTATPSPMDDPLPFDQRVAIATDFLNAHSLLNYPYRTEPSATDPDGIRFIELLDGIPLVYGVGKNPGMIERINISIDPDGQISSLFHSHHHYQPLDTYPILTAEQAWARLAQPNATSRSRYAVLAGPPKTWTRAGSEPTELIIGYLNNENDGTTFYADDGRFFTLLDIPADLPLYPGLEIFGTVTDSGLDWSSIQLLDGGYGLTLSCGGGGGGGGYTPDANFGGGNFATISLAPRNLPNNNTDYVNSIQPGDVIEGMEGNLYIFRVGSGTVYSFSPTSLEGGEIKDRWLARLQGEIVVNTEYLQNLPIKIWGTVLSLNGNGQPIIAIDRYEEVYPGTRIQAWLGTQQIITLEGQDVLVLNTFDGEQFVLDHSIQHGAEVGLIGTPGDTVVVEGYLIPGETFGDIQVLTVLSAGLENGRTDLSDYVIESNLIQNNEDSEGYTNPSLTITGHVTIESVELMYSAITLNRCTPEFVNNPEYVHFFYAEPVWVFTGHFDDGRLFEVQIQALPDEFLR